MLAERDPSPFARKGLTLSNLHVCVADPAELCRRRARDFFRAIGVASVRECGTAADVEQLVQARSIDLVLVDVALLAHAGLQRTLAASPVAVVLQAAQRGAASGPIGPQPTLLKPYSRETLRDGVIKALAAR